MIDLFKIGGPLFMGILTIILISMLAIAVYIIVQKGRDTERQLSVSLVKEVGIFGLVVGIFGQFIGLYQALMAIEQMGSVSPEMLATGLKVSSITTLYGFLICIIGWLLYFGLKVKN